MAILNCRLFTIDNDYWELVNHVTYKEKSSFETPLIKKVKVFDIGVSRVQNGQSISPSYFHPGFIEIGQTVSCKKSIHSNFCPTDNTKGKSTN